MANVYQGFAVGDWVTVRTLSENMGISEAYSGRTGCIESIRPGGFYPFDVVFDSDSKAQSRMGFSAEELKLNEDYLKPYTVTVFADGMDQETMDLFFGDEVDTRTEAETSRDVTFGLRYGGGDDMVNHPSHYAEGWSNGAEVIDITENLNFSRGNAIKYIARAGKKVGNLEKEIEDLRKAAWYINREIARLESE
jgi:hypothetical protein